MMCTSEHIGDTLCNDTNNNEECKWEIEDCCFDNQGNDNCDVCACLDLGVGESGTTTAAPPTTTTTTDALVGCK